ncbi:MULTISPECIES: YrdB family protein [Dyadobacter]|uniref:YrdB family protein n=1 Tax=Dyadobacter chenhuakuii TaxID=2909339 RepID=A0A9X1QIL9_9BACT|nr:MULTISPECIES: YrdB family protein [Dyadobacter]MCE7071764.1 YrdB family protein [Dyadobacter sp. CY327]MCF2496408.1 YrdB family protein [Dyadobacter chenhuakuii]MCF2501147.1 YrdB family protein [Dyadobacter chenhuakuii]MCF2519426.1 YrdB family protein [Dyadobacter sp. CY351]USJ30465.1 YrdB family protein [Dyadobacter chenhuakuii]
MDRRETDDQARATKNTKNVWKWILGVGIVLMAIAFWGGFFNHNENFTEAETPSEQGSGATGAAGAAAADSVASDTIMENVRKTE